MKLVQLIYSSRVTGRLTLDTVQSILTSATTHNPSVGITGFLAFDDCNFLQVIEGGTTVINQLYRHISRDPRHEGLHLISFREIAERQFPYFAMGDCNLTQVDATTIERCVGSAVFEPAKLSTAAALGLLQELERLRRQDAEAHGL